MRVRRVGLITRQLGQGVEPRRDTVPERAHLTLHLGRGGELRRVRSLRGGRRRRGARTVAATIMQLVRALDGFNRTRFQSEVELLAAWDSASNVRAAPRPSPGGGTPVNPSTDGGEIRPAA